MQFIVPENAGIGGYFDGPRLARAHSQGWDLEAGARHRLLAVELTRKPP